MSDNILLQTASFEEYPKLQETVYAPKWYYSKEVKTDDFSKKVYYSKYENKAHYFKPYLTDLVTALKKFKIVNFDDVDLITIIPSHEPDVYSVTLDKLGSLLSTLLNVKYEKILIRTKNTQPSGVRSREASERYKCVTGSICLSRNLSEKKILLFDDVKTSGIEILESKKNLISAGVKDTITICLGINAAEDKDDLKTMVEQGEGGIWITNG